MWIIPEKVAAPAPAKQPLDLQLVFFLDLLPRIGGYFLRAACRRDKSARSLGARDGENLSSGISWFTFLLQPSGRRGKEC
jgi:hypothetical protein